MINIQLIAVGKLNAVYFKQAAAEYEKRLSKLCKLIITELEEEQISEKSASEAVIQKSLDKEGKSILNSVVKGSVIIALCIEGTQITSEALAQFINDSAVNGNGSIAFVIGSSHGLSKEVKNAAVKKLSISKMTFPHQLARVVLMEQIYRGFSILNNIKYHK